MANETLDLSTLYEHLPMGVFALGADARVAYCNRRFTEFLGAPRERLIGYDVRKLHDRRLLPAIEQALAGEPAYYEGPYDATTSSSHLILAMRCQPLFLPDGTPNGIIATFDDATERVRIEQTLREQLALVEAQAATIHTLGTPVLSVWREVLCLPVLGLVDDARAAQLTETLLEAIVRERARFAIIDLTGVDNVDTSTAQHLVQLFRAVSLVGAEAILCGMRPAVAQTVISLDVDMTSMLVKQSLHKALEHCIAGLS